MHVLRDSRFDDEAERFALRFTCDHCACFDRRKERCRHGWPTELHRLGRYRQALRPGDEVIFCKEFELP